MVENLYRQQVELNVRFLIRPFLYVLSSYVQTAKALVRLQRWTGRQEPLMVAYNKWAEIS